jgi:thiosulfate reductase cytochrome b subunit
LWHWLTALSFILLTITGIVLHFGSAGAAFRYDTATAVHDVSGIFMSVLCGIHLVFMIGTGYWRQYVPSGEKLWARLQAQVAFYTVGLGRDGPHAGPIADSRFNVLQQLSYLVVVFALLPLMIVTGLLYLYYPAFVPETVLGLAGLWPLALAHFALGILGAAYLVVHVYMATVGPNAGASLRLMTIGRTFKGY